jgi:hypothetical protein
VTGTQSPDSFFRDDSVPVAASGASGTQRNLETTTAIDIEVWPVVCEQKMMDNGTSSRSINVRRKLRRL